MSSYVSEFRYTVPAQISWNLESHGLSTMLSLACLISHTTLSPDVEAIGQVKRARRTNFWLNRHRLGSSLTCIARRVMPRAVRKRPTRFAVEQWPCRGLVRSRSPWYVRTLAPSSVFGRARVGGCRISKRAERIDHNRRLARGIHHP
jgi:hypothetical protein